MNCDLDSSVPNMGNGTIRITTRQSIQLHGVVNDNLWEVIHRINEIKLSTQSACGVLFKNISESGDNQPPIGRRHRRSLIE